MRWLPAVPEPTLDDTLLLLPDLPQRVLLCDREPQRRAALRRWPVELVGPAGHPDLAVGSDARALGATGATMVLLDGVDRTGALARAGYAVRTWRVTRTQVGTDALVPLDAPYLARRLRSGSSRRRPRQVLADAVRARQEGSWVTVASRRPGPPLAVGPGAAPDVALLLGRASPRRRSVFVLALPGGEPTGVVKVGRGPDAAARADAEQEVLLRLAELGVPGVPLARGVLHRDGLVLAAESALDGEPLGQALRSLPEPAGRRALERAADWLIDLGLATRTSPPPDGGLRMHRSHAQLQERVPAGAPGLLVHGDLSQNALLTGSGLGVLDWETARLGLPLHDLLPLLCQGLLDLRRIPPHEAPSLLLPALRGRTADGQWLLAQVRRSLQRCEVPLEHAGDLAGLALASWATLRLVHDELVTSAGGAVTPWTSPADGLLAAWWEDPQLGASWPALTARP